MKELRDEACSWEAQQLRSHIGSGLGKVQMRKQAGPEETEEAGWWEKQRNAWETQSVPGPADFPVSTGLAGGLTVLWFLPFDFYELPLPAL